MDTPVTKKDPRVEAAISHWAPRFVINGVPLTDFQEVTASIERWEDWCSAWSARAAIHEELGNKAHAEGFELSAGEHWTRAAVCYHFGKFLFVNDMAQLKTAHMKAVECRNKALPFLRPPGERVAIPYEGKHLYGNLRKPAGSGKAPIVVMCMGLDSAKEEMDDYETRFLKRGLATLAFDGPGQGEAEYDFPICPEYEKPVGAVIDYLETRSDVDTTRIGVWGVSLGGYYAPRAACFEKRIKACVALSGAYERKPGFEGRPSHQRRSIPGAHAQQQSRGSRQGRRAHDVAGAREEHHLSDLYRRGHQGPAHLARRGAQARGGSVGPVRSLGDRRRQSCREQPLVSLP